jgi:hypothetical protein
MRAVVLVVLAIVLGRAALAHAPSDAYLTIGLDGPAIAGGLEVALRDLDAALAIDADGDRAVTWAVVAGREAEIAAWALAGITLADATGACALRPGTLLVDRHADGAYAVVPFAAACPGDGGALTLTYRLLAAIDPLHRGLLRVVRGAAVETAVLGPDRPSLVLARDRAGGLVAQLWSFARDGVRHILLGYDHLLFLIALLLPAVLRRGPDGWRPVGSAGEALWSVLAVVTAFTVAHSLTLALAVLHLVVLPTALVESLVALSIVVAAADNIVPFVRRRVLLAFAFGLVHGLGFAGALDALGLEGWTLLTALVAFNLGVEAGQLAVVALVLPALSILRGSPAYRPLLLRAGSAAIVLAGAVWLAERAPAALEASSPWLVASAERLSDLLLP